ncbi:MAG: hypothetical protein M1407_00050 [Deltaproteobacteria bacterium]|nr:hypothetical protein [Deltaproteobacteria bacterium]
MNIKELDPVQIRKLGLKALAEILGPVGMVYLLNFYELGTSDYTKERKNWLGELSVFRTIWLNYCSLYIVIIILFEIYFLF